MAGLHAYAVEMPRLRITAESYRQATGRAPRLEAKRVADHDEDAATLAIAACHALLALGGPVPSALFTASADAEPFAALLAEALGLAGARTAEHRGPTAALDALLAANDAVAQGHGAALVVSADAPSFASGDDAEASAGAGAMALLLTAKGPIQLRRSAHGTSLGDALRHLTRTQLSADSVARVAVADMDRALVQEAQGALPKARVASASAQLGDVGATAPLLSLAAALEEGQPGDVLVLGAAGAGVATALALELDGAPVAATLRAALALPTQSLDHPRLARLRGWLSPPASDVSQGAAISAAQYAASLPARLRFLGQRCMACNAPQFPPREACKACGAGRLEPFALSGRGEVHSVVTIGRGSAPAEFGEQQRRAGAYDVAIVALAEGPRVAAMVCEAPAGQLRIGDPVALVVRRLYVQDGAVRYGFKARPLG
jgi:hydroxymethylglutaryl-CoA synthase